MSRVKRHLHGDNRKAFMYSLSANERVKVLCEPLQKLNIGGFGYFRIFPNGRYLHLTNGLTEFQKAYFEEVTSLGIYEARFQKVPLHESRNLVWCLPKNFSQDKILYLSQQNGFVHGIDFYTRNSDSIENFYFILSNAKHTDTSCLLDKNYVQCLKDFMNYFKYSASDLIDCADKNRLASYSQPFDISFQPNIKMPAKISEFKNIIWQSPLILVKGEVFDLSKREHEILELIHKNSKEIALKLNLSYKTVEGYIEKLKNKLGVYLKSDLVDISITNKLIKPNLKK